MVATPPPAPAQKPQPSAPPSEEPAILAVLKAYASAYSGLDPNAVKRVYPSVNLADMNRAFAGLRSQQMQILNEQVSVGGLAATVSCTVVTVFQGQAGAPQRRSQSALFSLEKRNGTWIIVGRK